LALLKIGDEESKVLLLRPIFGQPIKAYRIWLVACPKEGKGKKGWRLSLCPTALKWNQSNDVDGGGRRSFFYLFRIKGVEEQHLG